MRPGPESHDVNFRRKRLVGSQTESSREEECKQYGKGCSPLDQGWLSPHRTVSRAVVAAAVVVADVVGGVARA